MKNAVITLLVFILGMSSCAVEQTVQIDHSENLHFIVAGHTYGKAGQVKEGLYAPFRKRFEGLAKKQLDFVFLTGDVVPLSEEKYWRAADTQLRIINSPYHIAPGNHDLTSKEVYISQVGEPYGFFVSEGCLFILLDGVSDGWSIKGEQFEMFQNALSEHADSVSEIFVFTHTMIWWQKDNQFNEAKPNWTEGRWGEMNYWTQVEPLLQDLSNPVYLFAGDFGASDISTPLKYKVEDNLHYVMSGMGNEKFDHFLELVKKPERPVEIIVRPLVELDANSSINDFEIK